jgi:hypothetical protein
MIAMIFRHSSLVSLCSILAYSLSKVDAFMTQCVLPNSRRVEAEFPEGNRDLQETDEDTSKCRNTRRYPTPRPSSRLIGGSVTRKNEQNSLEW